VSQLEATRELGAALGRVPSGLCILTYLQNGTEAAILVSWVQQCSFDPPGVTVAIKKGRDALEILADGVPFALSILAEGQNDIVGYFARGGSLIDFAGPVDRAEGMVPTLASALVTLRCHASRQFDAGDHQLLLGVVEAGKLQCEGRPMVHVRKNGLTY
jgi:flavin reductase (DIM6/NTAB) family NADH-FMN oxidoreductase RutF